MKVQRFTGLTAREALGLVKEGLGAEAMILSNRSVPEGVEILACCESDFASAMERNVLAPTRAADATEAVALSAADPDGMQNLVSEIRTMRDALETQLAELTCITQQQRNPTRTGALKSLLAMGMSPSLARYLGDNMPPEQSLESGLAWAQQTLVRNLKVLSDESEVLDQNAVYALVGPTGVGKTTTTAKLAARCVMRHGAGKLALITTDGYRIGAHEQLRIYGRILGVMVHSVKDEVDLRLALDELKNKQTVLIDTVGMSQRDQMVAEQIAMLTQTQVPVKRLLCLNATCTIDTLNEVVHAYRGSGLAGCILTKIDEATSIGGVLDVVLRQKLKLFYVGTGQRVPEDLQLPNANALVGSVFETGRAGTSARYQDNELAAVISSRQIRNDPSVRGLHVA